MSLRIEDMQDVSRGQAGREPRTSRVSYTRVDQLLMYDLHYGIYTEPWNWGVSFRLNMPTFSKYIDGQDPEFPRTSNMVEGFHRGFRTRLNRPKPSVQEYFRAIREQQVTSDYHIDRLGVGKTPSKRRKTSHEELFKICSECSDYSSKLDYLFAVAKHFGHDIE